MYGGCSSPLKPKLTELLKLEEPVHNQTENENSKLVSLFGNRKETAAKEASESNQKDESAVGFFDAMKKNLDNEERLRRERLKANQSVLKSYRIKN
jgi:hypothetical protein